MVHTAPLPAVKGLVDSLISVILQKESFCIPKGLLLRSKTSPFAGQKESFCKAV